jgi:diamine N-acetyltransferase
MATAAGDNLYLRDVDLGNYYPIMMLELAPDQTEFVWTNSGPLAEAAYIPGFRPRALYLDDEPIGLGLWGPFYPGYAYDGPPEPGAYIIDHVMVDRRRQGKGYGRRLVELLIAELEALPDCRRILLAVHPGNVRAIALYEKLGFADIGRTHENDVLMQLARAA